VTGDTNDSTSVRTFLIADVRGYTAFTQQHGDEAGAVLAGRFAQLTRETVGARGGSVLELRGDEALCVFESPRQALRCAVDLQRAYADAIRSDPDMPLRVGIGIDAGEAVPVEGGYRGGALNLAARLCSLAKAGDVLVSEGIVHLARRVDGIDYVDRGRVELKGMHEPVRYYGTRFDLDLPAAPPAVPRWTLTRLAASALGGVAVVTLLAALAIARLGSPGTATLESNAIAELDPTSAAVRDQTVLSDPPGGIAYGLGRIWASDPAGSRLVGIDSATGSEKIVPTGKATPGAMTIANGDIWVVDAGASTVSQIDPDRGPVWRGRVGAGPTAAAAGAGGVWVTNADEGTLQRIDAATSRVSPAVAVGSQPVDVTYGLGFVWVVDQADGTLVQIDPAQRQVVATTPVGNGPTSVAVGLGHVWIANAPDNTVTRFDPRDPSAQRRVVVSGGPVAVTVTRDSVWVGTRSGSIVRIDPTQLVVASTRRSDSPVQALRVGGDHLWASTLASAGSHRGGTLHLGLEDDVDFIDPAMAYFLPSWQILSVTNDGLVGFQRTGGAAGSRLVPDLATSIPTPTDGGRTYRFVLRRGIRYSNGQPVRASDVRWAIERALTARASPGPGQEAEQGPAAQFLSKLAGADGCKPGAACDLGKGIETDDRAGTVTFHLTAPDPEFLYALALPFADPLPPGTPPPDSDRPVPSTGPYLIDRYERPHSDKRGSVMLVRNPRFHPWSPLAQPAGFADRMDWTLGMPVSEQLDAVRVGSLDAALGPDLSATPGHGGIRAGDAEHVHAFVEQVTFGAFLDTNRPPFDDVRVRRAMNLAIDRRTAVRLFGGPASTQVTCQTLPPGMAGYRPYCPYTLGGGPRYRGPDLKRARRLVSASHTAGRTVSVAGDPQNKRFSQLFARTLRALHYRTTLKIFPDSGTYYRAIGSPGHRWQIGFFGWSQDYPAPADFLDVVFGCGSPFDPSHFCDARVEKAVQRALQLQSSNPAAASLQWAQVDRMVTDAAPWIAAFNARNQDFVSARVGNYQHNPQWGMLIGQVWVR
jgi:ABC-type transport system substrate-binding protein/class 3 adenylate cyclase